MKKWRRRCLKYCSARSSKTGFLLRTRRSAPPESVIQHSQDRYILILIQCPWAELDREHAALSEDPNALLGGKGRSGQPYGGRIVFPIRARTRDNSNPGNAKLELERPELSSSDGFRREYGSSAFIRMRCDDKLAHHKELGSLLCRPFVLGGRVFRAFRRKDGNVFFVEVDEVLPGYDPPPPRYGANCRPKSFFGFVDWHNPRLLNSHQVRPPPSSFLCFLTCSLPECRKVFGPF